MKTRQLLFCTLLIILNLHYSFAQNENLGREFASIDSELQKWDQLRGEWLSKSILAISQNQPIPDRNFPEDFTPYELYSMIPMPVKETIRGIASSQRNTARNDGSNAQAWENIVELFVRPTCQTVSGRTFGDPHFSSFDGNSYSLQSVGEFILAKSNNGYFEVQTRQKANGPDFALNIAVAMNVGGDRFCIYGGEKPDSDHSTDLRLNGSPVHIENSTYFLPHGGTVRNTKNNYIITWPTGEKVSIQKTGSGFMNVTTLVYPCVLGGYQGLLGNANGTPDDDLKTPNRPNDLQLFSSLTRFNGPFGNTPLNEAANNAEKDYLERLSKDFGSYWRVTDMNTLFDYGIGQNSDSFTDLSFPSNHRTVGDLNQSQIATSRRNCENQGITGSDLRGCIFDNAYLNIPPAPQPIITDATDGVILPRIPKENGTPNVNKPILPKEPATELNNSNGIPNKIENVDEYKVINPVQNQPMSKPETKSEKTTTPKTTSVEPVYYPPIVEPKPKKIIFAPSKSTNTSPSPTSSPSPVFSSPASKPQQSPSSSPVSKPPASAPIKTPTTIIKKGH